MGTDNVDGSLLARFKVWQLHKQTNIFLQQLTSCSKSNFRHHSNAV